MYSNQINETDKTSNYKGRINLIQIEELKEEGN